RHARWEPAQGFSERSQRLLVMASRPLGLDLQVVPGLTPRVLPDRRRRQLRATVIIPGAEHSLRLTEVRGDRASRAPDRQPDGKSAPTNGTDAPSPRAVIPRSPSLPGGRGHGALPSNGRLLRGERQRDYSPTRKGLANVFLQPWLTPPAGLRRVPEVEVG